MAKGPSEREIQQKKTKKQIQGESEIAENVKLHVVYDHNWLSGDCMLSKSYLELKTCSEGEKMAAFRPALHIQMTLNTKCVL